MTLRSRGRWLALTGTAMAVLAACGGGSTPSGTGLEMQGVVLGERGQGMSVFLDLNNNQSFDAGEPRSGPVAADGSFSLSIGSPSDADLAFATLVVEGASYKAMTPAAAFVTGDGAARRTTPAVISPLTTLVAADLAWNGMKPQEAVQAVQQHLGLGAADPLADYSREPRSPLAAIGQRAEAALRD